MNVEERISYFKFIRDIPYLIALHRGEPDYCCSSKSIMLARMLEKTGLKTRQIICAFDWNQTPVPNELLALPRQPGETHQYLQVFIPERGEWVDCDPTWDAPLSKLGFEIAEWDGLSSTPIAVRPLETYTPEQTQKLMLHYDDPTLIDQHLEICRDFYDSLNKWLQTSR